MPLAAASGVSRVIRDRRGFQLRSYSGGHVDEYTWKILSSLSNHRDDPRLSSFTVNLPSMRRRVVELRNPPGLGSIEYDLPRVP